MFSVVSTPTVRDQQDSPGLLLCPEEGLLGPHASPPTGTRPRDMASKGGLCVVVTGSDHWLKGPTAHLSLCSYSPTTSQLGLHLRKSSPLSPETHLARVFLT